MVYGRAAWRTFVMGERGSPGGPRALANIVMILAEDLQQRGISVDAEGRVLPVGPILDGPPMPAPTAPAGNKKKSARASFLERTQVTASGSSAVASAATALATEARAQRIPSAFERGCDPQDLQAIRDVYGSRAQDGNPLQVFHFVPLLTFTLGIPVTLGVTCAVPSHYFVLLCFLQTLINVLLAFDAYFKWYRAYKRSIPFKCEMELREDRAFDNMHLAIDMQETFERLTINNHKSFLPHLTVYKVCPPCAHAHPTRDPPLPRARASDS